MKKALSLVLTAVMLLSMLMAAPFVSADAPGFIVMSDGSETAGREWWVNGNSANWETMTYATEANGNKYVSFDSAAEGHAIYGAVFNRAFQFKFTDETVIDLGAYPIFEFMYRNPGFTTNAVTEDGTAQTSGHIQVALANAPNEDGHNMNNMGWSFSETWQRFTVDASGAAGIDTSKFDAFKIAHMNYSGKGSFELDVDIDNVVVLTAATKEARAAEETRVQGLIDALGTVTVYNYAAKAAAIAAADAAVAAANAAYPNFMVNTAKLDAAKAVASEMANVSDYDDVFTWDATRISAEAIGKSEAVVKLGTEKESPIGTYLGAVTSKTFDATTLAEGEKVIAWGVGNVIGPHCTVRHDGISYDTLGIAVGDSYTVVAKVYARSMHGTTLSASNAGGAATGTLDDDAAIVLSAGNLGNATLTGAEYDVAASYVDPTYGYRYKLVSITGTRAEDQTDTGRIDYNAVGSQGFTSLACYYGFSIYNKNGDLVYDAPFVDTYGGKSYNPAGWGHDWGGTYLTNANYQIGDAAADTGADIWGLYASLGDAYGTYALEYTMKVDNATGDVATVTANSPAVEGNYGTMTITADDVKDGYATYTHVFEYTALEGADGRVEAVIDALGNADITLTNVRLVKIDNATLTEWAIDAIGEVELTAESKAKIDAARAKYNALTAEEKAAVSNYNVLSKAEDTYVKLVSEATKSEYEAVYTYDATRMTGDDIGKSEAATFFGTETGRFASGTYKAGTITLAEGEKIIGFGVGDVIQHPTVRYEAIGINGIAKGDTFTVDFKVLARQQGGLNFYDQSTNAVPTAKDAVVIRVGGGASAAEAQYVDITGAQYEALPSYVDPVYGYRYKIVTMNFTKSWDHDQMNLDFCAPGATGYILHSVLYGITIYGKDGAVVNANTFEEFAAGNSQTGHQPWGDDWGGVYFTNAYYKLGAEAAETGTDIWGMYAKPKTAGLYALEYTMKVENATGDVAKLIANKPAVEGHFHEEVLTADDVVDGFATYRTEFFAFDPTIGDGRLEATIDAYGNADITLTNVRIVKATAAMNVEYAIDAIGTVEDTAESKAAVEAARAAYDALSAEEQAEVTNYATLVAAEKALADIALAALTSDYDDVYTWDITEMQREGKGHSEAVTFWGTGGHPDHGNGTGIVVASSYRDGAITLAEGEKILGWGVANVMNHPTVRYEGPINLSTLGIDVGEKYTIVAKVFARQRTGDTMVNTANVGADGRAIAIGAAGGVYELTGAQYDALPSYVDPVDGYRYKLLTVELTRAEDQDNIKPIDYYATGSGFTMNACYYGYSIYDSEGNEVLTASMNDFPVVSGAESATHGASIPWGYDWGGIFLTNANAQMGAAAKDTGADIWGLYATPAESGLYAFEYTMKVENATGDVVKFTANAPAVEGNFGEMTVTAADVKDGFAIYTHKFAYDSSVGDGRVEAVIDALGNADIALTNVRLVKLGAADNVIYAIDAIGEVSYTGACKDAIEAARAAYDKLSDDEKAAVTNYDVLTAAEAAYAELAAGPAGVDAIINALPAVDAITEENVKTVKADAAAAREAYEKLDAEGKNAVTALATLEAVEAKVDEVYKILAKYVMAHSFDNTDNLAQHIGQWTMDIDTDPDNHIEGDGSVVFIGGDPAARNPIGGTFHFMSVFTFDEVDTKVYPYFEIAVKSDNGVEFGKQYQINFANSKTEKWTQDGKNTTGDWKQYGDGTWNRHLVNVLAAGWTVDYPGEFPELADKYDTIRFSYVGLEIPEGATMYVDGAVFFNQEYLDARNAEEARITKLVQGLSEQSSVEEIRTVAAAITAAEAEYVNFMISNTAKWNRIAAFIAVEEKIDAIGEVTAAKKTMIEAAREAYDLLSEDQQAKVGNIEVLEDAEQELIDIAAAREVDSMIKKLPDANDLEGTEEEGAAIKAARDAYEALNDNAKSKVAKLEDLETIEREYDLIINPPYTLGELDGKEGITAADALMALQAAVKKITLDETQTKAADVDGKEGITAGDALCILQYAVKKIDKFPVENVAE